MAGRRICSVCCAPQPIARIMQVFPKLALLFLVVHISVMIYSFFSPTPHAEKPVIDTPPGVVDPKMINGETLIVHNANRLHADNKNADSKTFRIGYDDVSKRNKTVSSLLERLKERNKQMDNNHHDNKNDSNLKNRYPVR